jgi:hypothetical protein
VLGHRLESGTCVGTASKESAEFVCSQNVFVPLLEILPFGDHEQLENHEYFGLGHADVVTTVMYDHALVIRERYVLEWLRHGAELLDLNGPVPVRLSTRGEKLDLHVRTLILAVPTD